MRRKRKEKGRGGKGKKGRSRKEKEEGDKERKRSRTGWGGSRTVENREGGIEEEMRNTVLLWPLSELTECLQ